MIQQLLLGAGPGVILSISPASTTGFSPHTGNHTVTVTGGVATAYAWTFDGWTEGEDDGTQVINSGAATATVNVTVTSSLESQARFRVVVTVGGLNYEATCTRRAIN